MNLAQFLQRRYAEYKTPIEKLNRLTECLDRPNIYMKRDDLLGLTLGGNKTSYWLKRKVLLWTLFILVRL